MRLGRKPRGMGEDPEEKPREQHVLCAAKNYGNKGKGIVTSLATITVLIGDVKLLHQTGPRLSKISSSRPPYYEALGVTSKPQGINRKNPRECTWGGGKEGITMEYVTVESQVNPCSGLGMVLPNFVCPLRLSTPHRYSFTPTPPPHVAGWRGELEAQKCGNYIGPLQDEDGHLTNRDMDKANMFNAFFASVFNTDDRLTGSQCPELEDHDYENYQFPVNPEVMKNLLFRLDPYKFMRSDGIHTRILKEQGLS
ncbi:hypothetical protein TURU_089449 [Turdus rufiventris]|nr:hypothetical protein TURU_089449 [Turdus rufiventris]